MEKDNIVHIRLFSGDELFGRLIGEENGVLFLEDLMVMETLAVNNDEVSKYLFMSRWVQYCDDHSMVIGRDEVMYVKVPTDAVKNHYRVSLEFAQKVSDHTLETGIRDATAYLKKIIDKESHVVEVTVDTVSETKH